MGTKSKKEVNIKHMLFYGLYLSIAYIYYGNLFNWPKEYFTVILSVIEIFTKDEDMHFWTIGINLLSIFIGYILAAVFVLLKIQHWAK